MHVIFDKVVKPRLIVENYVSVSQQSTCAAASSARAGMRNPGSPLQLRLSWAMVYFGSSTFLGFAMTVGCVIGRCVHREEGPADSLLQRHVLPNSRK